MNSCLASCVDKVDDALTKLKRDPWARAASPDVAEEGVTVVVEGDVFPPKGSEGGSAGGHLRILLL